MNLLSEMPTEIHDRSTATPEAFTEVGPTSIFLETENDSQTEADTTFGTHSAEPNEYPTI